ncbi:MAG: DUF1761 domain-containing protein [Bacteroidota bacterium]|jgi:hypothetical protein
MPITITIDVIPLLISSIVCFALGAFWFSPALFGRKWKSLRAVQDHEGITLRSYSLSFIVIVILNIFMSFIVDLTHAATMSSGIVIGVLMWSGFCATTAAIQFLFERRSLPLFLITSGYSLVLCVISATLNALWR